MESRETSNDRIAPKRHLPWRRIALLLAAIVIAVLLVAFVAQNGEDAAFDLLWWEFTAPLWLMLLMTAVVGFAVGELVRYSLRRRRVEPARQRDRDIRKAA